MKTIQKFFTIAIFFALLHCGLNAFGDTPPPPPQGGGQGGNSNVPGGGAPIGSGLGILLLMGVAYGGKKVLEINNENSNE